MDLGKLICAARKAHGMTQECLAELCNITASHLKHIESGHRKPSVELLFHMVQLLDISLDAVLLEKTEPKRVLYLDGLTDKEAEMIEGIAALFREHHKQKELET